MRLVFFALFLCLVLSAASGRRRQTRRPSLVLPPREPFMTAEEAEEQRLQDDLAQARRAREEREVARLSRERQVFTLFVCWVVVVF